MNAIVLQVRPVADALYASRYEPWSRYLTGRQGRRPEPYWDPLEFAVAEAHKRGLELHAWFNPYRVAFGREPRPARNHVSQTHPRYVVRYGNYLWMDPGIPEVRRLMIRAVIDVVRRYDVDGVHIDDYFYPYPETEPGSRASIDFPDRGSYAAYRRRGGRLEKADWRRNNVNVLVREFYAAVKAEKRWVKVGISPFGIWRPGNPPSIQAGIDQYDELYADVRKWLHEGSLDYLVPQLYWPIFPPEQSYPVLLQWWVEENLKGRHMWPGLPLHRLVSTTRAMRADDIVHEIALTRTTPGATGHVHFSAKVIMQNADSIASRLAVLYAEPALVPATPWLDAVPPPAPTVAMSTDSASGEAIVRFAPADQQVIRHWIVQSRSDSTWHTRLLPGTARTAILKDAESAAELVSVSAVDRVGNAGPPTILRRQQ
jgi:uncharacterized lipoprotein YddW (UPF0748 family)